MNEDANVKLAKELLSADQAIHEQQLGVQWVRPLEVGKSDVQQVLGRVRLGSGGRLTPGRPRLSLIPPHRSNKCGPALLRRWRGS